MNSHHARALVAAIIAGLTTVACASATQQDDAESGAAAVSTTEETDPSVHEFLKNAAGRCTVSPVQAAVPSACVTPNFWCRAVRPGPVGSIGAPCACPSAKGWINGKLARGETHCDAAPWPSEHVSGSKCVTPEFWCVAPRPGPATAPCACKKDGRWVEGSLE